MAIQRGSRLTCCRPMKTGSAISLLALLAAPVAAQQSVQDFNLPPNPTPTPTVEGPADQIGPVAIPPRAIPAETPTPRPTPVPTPSPTATPSPTPAATGTPVVQQLPAPSPAPSPALAPTASPLQDPPPQALASPEPNPSPTPSALDSLPGFSVEPAQPSGSGEMAGADQAWPQLPEWWPWAAGLFAALLTAISGGWWIARRRASRPAPTIEAPIVVDENAGALAASNPRLELTFEAEQLMRSMMMLTLKYRLATANRSSQPVRDISIAADLVSARRELPVEQQLATEATSLPVCHAIERIGPNQSASVSGQLQLPVEAIEIFRQGNLPLCVPLVRLKLESPSSAPILQTLLIGIGAAGGGGRVHPLPLSGPPGGYEGVRSRPID